MCDKTEPGPMDPNSPFSRQQAKLRAVENHHHQFGNGAGVIGGGECGPTQSSQGSAAYGPTKSPESPSVRAQIHERMQRIADRAGRELQPHQEMLTLLDREPTLEQMIDGLNRLGLLR